MSLFQPETLCVAIEADRATIVKLTLGRRPRVLADGVVPLAPTSAAGSQAPVLDAVAERLATPAFKARRLRVVLADSLVRYFIADRPQGVRNHAELESLIQARFEEQFGLPRADWVIVGDLDPRARKYLVCAAPRQLVEAVKSLCTGLNMQLQSLEPFAVGEINRWRRKTSGSATWFAATDSQTVTLGYWNSLGWQGMRTHAAGLSAAPAIPGLVERDALLHGVAEAAPIVCTGIVGQPVANTIALSPGMQRIGAGLWPGQNETWSRTYRTALAGVWP